MKSDSILYLTLSLSLACMVLFVDCDFVCAFQNRLQTPGLVVFPDMIIIAVISRWLVEL